MNNPWVIGIVCALVGVLGGLLIRDRRKKAFGWEVKFKQALVTRTSKDEQIRILFNEQEVDTPYLIAVRFTNSGNVAISEEDYNPPLILNFGAQILQSTWVFEPPVSVSGDNDGKEGLKLKPLLLNPGEHFDVLVYTDKEPSFSCRGRIRDGRIVETRKVNARGALLNYANSWVSMLSFGLLYWMLTGGSKGAFHRGMNEYGRIFIAFLGMSAILALWKYLSGKALSLLSKR